MFPIICKIGPVTVYSYGTMLALAILICTGLLARDAKKEGISAEFVVDFVFWVILSGIIGARLFYVILNIDFFIEQPEQLIMLHRGGLAFQGGLIAGTMTGILYCRKKNVGILKFADVAIPYMALGQGIGRIGCFLNGCCFGKPVYWGLGSSRAHELHHPTQLYMFAGLLVVFFILKRYQRKATFSGEVFVLYFILASLLRFFIEFFRADHDKTLLGLSVYQYVCIGLILGASYVRSRVKSRSA